MTVDVDSQPTATDRRPRLPLIADAVTGIALAVGVSGYAIHNLGNRYFWTDESSTFFTALGWPAPGQSLGDLRTAWQGTMAGFLDPGLFHMLVRVWAEVFGTGIVTLRFLPFVFLLVYVVSLLFMFRLVGAPWFLSVGGTSVMMLENITPYYGVELRPYSAGLAASVALPLLALVLIRSTTVPRLLLFLVGIAILGSMQYNTLPITCAVAVMLAIAWLQTKSRRSRSMLAIAATIAVLWLPMFFIVSRGNPFLLSGGEAQEYIPDLVLMDMPTERALQVLSTNLFSPTALPRSVFLLVVPLLWWRRWLPSLRNTSDRTARVINLLWVYVAIATLAIGALAVLGFLPWVLGTRWSIADVGLIGVSLAGLVGLLMRTNWASRRSVLGVLAVGSLLVTLVGSARLWSFERPGDVDYLRSLAPVILSGTPGEVVVDYRIHSDVRYWMEFSGEFDDLKLKWLSNYVRSTDGFKDASTAEIESWLASTSDVLLLRSQRALDEADLALPRNVRVVHVADDASLADLPVVLVKR